MKNEVLVAVVLAAVINATRTRLEHERYYCPAEAMPIPPPPKAASIDAIAEDLGLTAEQTGALIAILTTSEENIRPLMQSAAISTTALYYANKSQEYDSATQLALDVEIAINELYKAITTAWTKVYESNILTKDQFTKLLTVFHNDLS